MQPRRRFRLLRYLALFGLGVAFVVSPAVATSPTAQPERTSAVGSEAATRVGSKTSATAPGQGKKRRAKEKYLRLQRDKRGRPIAMEAAIVRFQPSKLGKRWPVVDLVGAVHVAEPSFFARLNREFAGYDAVLYELLAPEGTRPRQGQKPRGGNPLSTLQTGLTRLLNLQFQLEGINYRRPNMVHADMSPEEFRKSMRDRGETVWSMFLRMLGYAMMQQAKDPSGKSDVDLLMAFFDKNRALALKRAMAKQFEDLGGVMIVLDGPDGSTLISERNKKALSVLRRELNSGKRKIAIFYGAGHMPDMAKRLQKDFSLKPTGTRWLVAWDMADAKSEKASKSSGEP